MRVAASATFANWPPPAKIGTFNCKPMVPWVLVKPEAAQKVTAGGLYLPEGNLLERLGHLVAVVVSAGPGYWDKPEGKTKKVFVRSYVNPGDRVVFRGHLQDANKVGREHCFMHIRDLIGVLEGDAELELALPYGN